MSIKDQRKTLTNNIAQTTLLYEKYAQSYGLTYNSMIIYYLLEYYGACTQKQISEQWAIPKQTVNHIVKKSMKEGILEFVNKEARKNKLIRFTKKGKEEFSSIVRELMLIEEEVIKNMGTNQMKMLIKCSESFYQNFKSILEARFD